MKTMLCALAVLFLVVCCSIASSADVTGEPIDDDDDDDAVGEGRFKFFITARRLLKLGLHNDRIHADATYKLVWQGFPVLVVGTTDEARQFHPFGLAVCSSETTADYEFLFRAVQKGVEAASPTGSKYQPVALIADSAAAITNGFVNVFGVPQYRTHCFAHVKTGKTGISQKVRKIKNTEYEQGILNDVDCLQLANGPDEFTAAVQLFLSINYTMILWREYCLANKVI